MDDIASTPGPTPPNSTPVRRWWHRWSDSATADDGSERSWWSALCEWLGDLDWDFDFDGD